MQAYLSQNKLHVEGISCILAIAFGFISSFAGWFSSNEIRSRVFIWKSLRDAKMLLSEAIVFLVNDFEFKW